MWIASIALAAEPVDLEEPRAPEWTVVLPFGVAQFAQGRPAEATWFAVVQGGLGAGSLAVWLDLRRRAPVRVLDPTVSTRPLRTVQIEKYAVQWPLTAGFWGAWVGSCIEAHARNHDPRWVVTPTADGLGVQAVAAF